MSNIERILVGFDFSPRCEQTLLRASALAKAWEASLLVVHVLPEVPYEGASQNVDLVDLMGGLESKVSEKLEAQVEKLLGSDREVESRVRTGDPSQEILELARDQEAQLILLGNQSHSEKEELVLGRTCEDVLQHSHIPVWVEQGKGLGELNTLLLPTDLSSHSRFAVVEGLQWAKQFKAKAYVLHVVEVPFVPPFSLIDPKKYEETIAPLGKKQFEEFMTTLPTEGVEVETLLTYGDPAGEVERYIQSLSASLVVLSTHGRTGLATKLLGSMAKKILRHAPCPVLLSRPESLDFSWLQKAFSLKS